MDAWRNFQHLLALVALLRVGGKLPSATEENPRSEYQYPLESGHIVAPNDAVCTNQTLIGIK